MIDDETKNALLFIAAILTAWLIILFPAKAAETLTGPIEAEVIRVIDGDTIDVETRIWLGQTVKVRVRLAGVDTPEMKGKCQVEKNLALAAKARVEKLIGKRGGVVWLRNIHHGKYANRVVAEVVTVTGDSIAHDLILQGLGRKYDGGKRQGWCG